MKKDEKKDKQQPEQAEEPVTGQAAAEEENPADQYEQPAAEEKQSKEAEYLEMAQRIQAEFDNYRRRNANARADAILDGKVEAIKAFLPVMDNLERALETERTNGTQGSLMEGLEMVLKQMKQMLADLGVEEIDATGKEFDPNLHNAVMQVEAGEDRKAGQVAQVFAKGYKLKDKVLRYAMVQVTI